MHSSQLKGILKRSAALLLTAMLVLTALPRAAMGESADDAAKRVQVDSDSHGNAAKLPGSTQHVTLIAVAHRGYVFDHWVATVTKAGGYSGLYYGSQITVPIPATGETSFKACFREADNPSLGVLVKVPPDNSGCKASGTKVAVDDKTEVTTTITATPQGNYEFSHWVLSAQELLNYNSVDNSPYYAPEIISTFYESSMQVTAPPRWRYTYTAHFVEKSAAKGVFTAIKVLNEPGGTVQSVLGGTTTGDAVFRQDGIATQKTTIQAFPASDGYVFDHWERTRTSDSSVRRFSANPLTITVENEHDLYTAIFYFRGGANGVFLDPCQFIENSSGSYTDGGGYSTGDKLYNPALGAGQTTVLQATPASDEYVFDHWEKTGVTGVYSVTNPLTVNVTSSHDVYCAIFTKLDATTNGVFTAVKESGWGTATGDKVYNPALGTGQQTVLQAYPTTDNYVFSHWTLNRAGEPVAHDPISTSNPYTVSVEKHRDTYTAVFKPVEQGKGVITKAVLLKSDGTIDSSPSPSPGSTSGDTASTVNSAKVNQTTLQAFPASNKFIFIRWDLHRNAGQSGESIITSVSTANPYTVKVSDDNDVYWAVFMATPENDPVDIDGKATGIANAKNFKDVWRKFTDPSYSVTRGSLESKAAAVTSDSSGRLEQASPTTDNSAALKQLEQELGAKDTALGKNRSEMENLPDAVLVSSKGESFYTDDIRSVGYLDIADEAVQKRFGKLYDFEILQAVKITGPTGIDDTEERTLVWKNSGATYRDRLMLMQFLPNGKQNIVTPIANEEGTLTFTLSAVADPDFLLLRIFLLDGGQDEQ